MGFIVTAPTPLPVDGDGSQDQETWGESGGPFSVPAEEGAGLGAQALPHNTVNYNAQKSGRWSRATGDRMVRSDEGFVSSCIVFEGTWNTGGGTLDVTLTPTRVGVDAAVPNDGGIVLEIKAPPGSPETLLASRDTYLNLNEAGAFELQAVANGAPPPVPTAGFVAIWVLVTDGTELTAANLVDGIAPFVCLGPTIGIRAAVIEDLTVQGPSKLSGTVAIGGQASDVVTAIGTTSFTEVATFNGGATVAAGQTLTANGDCILGDGAGDAIIVPGTMTIQQNATFSKSAILGNNSPPAVIGEVTRDPSGAALYHDGDHARTPAIRATGLQEANTGAAAITTTATTSTRQHAPVSLLVTASLYISRAVAGTIDIRIEEDNGGGVFSILGSAFITPTISASFTPVQFSRVRTVDSTRRLFRVRADAGGSTQDMKEVTLIVRPID